MRKLILVALLAGFWAGVVQAEDAAGSDPVVEVDPGVDLGVTTVDPGPGSAGEVDVPVIDVVELPVGDGDVCPHHHLDHDGIAGHCHEIGVGGMPCKGLDGPCPHPRPGDAEGGDVDPAIYTLMTSSSIGGDLGGPRPHFRNLTGAEQAMQNSAALGGVRSLQFENSLRTRLMSSDDRQLGAGVPVPGAGREQPGLLGRMFGRDRTPPAVSDTDRAYARQLTAIDQLRDQALATGNTRLLQQADQMQQQLQAEQSARGFRLFRR